MTVLLFRAQKWPWEIAFAQGGIRMLRALLVVVVLLGANAGLDAQCAKCCGWNVLQGVAHRECDGFQICHVSWCDFSTGLNGCCWDPNDEYNDVCAHPESGEWGLHGCY